MMMMMFTTISARVLWTCCQPLHHTMQNAAIVPMLYRDYGTNDFHLRLHNSNDHVHGYIKLIRETEDIDVEAKKQKEVNLWP